MYLRNHCDISPQVKQYQNYRVECFIWSLLRHTGKVGPRTPWRDQEPAPQGGIPRRDPEAGPQGENQTDFATAQKLG